MTFQHILTLLTTLLLSLIGIYFFLVSNNKNILPSKPIVVCTTTIIGDTIKNIASDTIHLKILMGPGVDPHTYKPIEQDIINITSANLIVYHGLHLEARMSNLFANMQSQITTIAITQDIPKDRLIYSPDYAQFPDPHVWFDPMLWIYAVQTITTTLQKLIPNHANLYEKNKNIYLQKIKFMYQTTKQKMLKIPQEKRFLITGHDAFSYFAHAYDCNVISLQGISTASEAGTCDVQNLINFIVHHKIPTIFAESCIPTRNMQALMQGACAHNWPVKLGQELFSDALGSPETLPGTYLGMIEYNVESIVMGLNQPNNHSPALS